MDMELVLFAAAMVKAHVAQTILHVQLVQPIVAILVVLHIQAALVAQVILFTIVMLAAVDIHITHTKVE